MKSANIRKLRKSIALRILIDLYTVLALIIFALTIEIESIFKIKKER